VELKPYARTVNAVCIQCLSVLDARTPSLKVLQEFEERQRRTPLIPLGSRGKLQGDVYEIIGFQIRAIDVDGVVYEWSEYLLLNPYKGYRYLTEYQGHWNFVRTLHAIPLPSHTGRKKAVLVSGRSYTHFQSATAETVYVMGQFPWQVRVGETADVEDYIAPPHVISSERTPNEITWSAGTYTEPEEIWKAFRPPGSPPRRHGVYANQPSPHTGKVESAWKLYMLLLGLWVAALITNWVTSPRETVFRGSYAFDGSDRSEHSFVTPMFDLRGRESSVNIDINTDVSNDWVYLAFALINDDTGTAYNAGREISYYFGRDGDGAWTEGNRRGSVHIRNVPPGRYYLRVEPEMANDGRAHTARYDFTVTRGVAGFGWFIASFFLLLLPPIFTSVRAFSFENQRWAESDYGALISSSSSDSEE
jgi:hypothetical protein